MKLTPQGMRGGGALGESPATPAPAARPGSGPASDCPAARPGPGARQPRQLSSRSASPRPTRRSGLLTPWFLLALAGTAALVVASLFVGVFDISGNEGGSEMFFITRIPRTLALVLAGSAMTTAGLIMQMLSRNRFVEPTTAGTAEWAGLGLLLSYMFLPQAGLNIRILLASLAAFGGTMVFMAILTRVASQQALVVPLVGIMLGAVVSAFSTFLALSTNLLQLLGTWFMGSFTSVVRGRYEILWVVGIVALLSWFVADRLTIMGMGREVATTVGLNHQAMMLVGTAMVAVVTGVTTVVVGFLPFLGLVVPNLVSILRGDNLRENIVWAWLGGIALVTTADILGRVVRMPFEVPVSMVLGVIGSAVFLVLLWGTRRA